MDIFKFTNPTAPTKMQQGEIINGLTSKTWIERYGKEGEFTFVAPVSSGMRDILPVGTFISHTDTTDIMIVENHEINEASTDGTSDITITGRGYETFFESRVVGSNRGFPVAETIVDYPIIADFTWNQIVAVIQDHTYASALVDPNNAIPFMTALSLVTSYSGSPASIARTLKRDTLYAGVLTLLAIDGLGIKVVRPGPWSPLGSSSEDVCVGIHFGVDRSADVIFSYDTGQLISADYLWSNKNFRNAALLTGKWVEVVVVPSDIEYARRMLFIDASDIDNTYDTIPTGSDLTAVETEMTQRGIEILASQVNIAITSAQAASNAITAAYRTDFDVGDIVTVAGDYNENAKMRISEYVEIEDSTGESGYPTLVLV